MALPHANPSDEVARHPRDPEPVPSTKAVTALALSVVALVTSVVVGGVIPAAMALWLAQQADADIESSRGFLLGAGRVRRARRFAIIALWITGFELLILGLLWTLVQLVL